MAARPAVPWTEDTPAAATTANAARQTSVAHIIFKYDIRSSPDQTVFVNEILGAASRPSERVPRFE